MEVFWAKNIHITDLELENISNIKMQRNNKLKPSRKKQAFRKTALLGYICYMLLIYQGWDVYVICYSFIKVGAFHVCLKTKLM